MLREKTAILIFAHSSEEECKQKSIAKADVLFEQLNAQTLKTVQKTGLPYYLFTENEQVGHNFGERFVNAIQSVYDKGFDNVITIGNDSPELSKTHLHKAAKKLDSQKFVLGPSLDGGFYLMGLPKKLFDREAFIKLPWQTAKLAKSIFSLVSAGNAAVAKLQYLTDIDRQADLKQLLKAAKFPRALFNFIRSILFYTKLIFDKTVELVGNFQQKLYYNKGSPLLH